MTDFIKKWKMLVKKYSPIFKALKNGMNIGINSNLIIKLIAIDGLRSNIVTIISETDARLKKTGNPYAGKPVKKISRWQAMINTNYQNGVANQLTKEGKSTDEYKKGKSTMQLAKDDNYNGCLAVNEKNGKLMLVCRPFDGGMKRETEYYLFGKLIDKEIIKPYIPEKNHATNQGTEKEILWRNIYLENIKEIVIDGKSFLNR